MSWGKYRKVQKLSVPMEKEVIKFDKDGNGSVITISSKVKFIDSARFMATSLSNFVDNFTEEIYKIKCNDYVCFFKYESIKEKLISYRVLFWSEDYSNQIDEELKKQFNNTFNFSNNDIC